MSQIIFTIAAVAVFAAVLAFVLHPVVSEIIDALGRAAL
jgi:hypothetical protein